MRKTSKDYTTETGNWTLHKSPANHSRSVVFQKSSMAMLERQAFQGKQEVVVYVKGCKGRQRGTSSYLHGQVLRRVVQVAIGPHQIHITQPLRVNGIFVLLEIYVQEGNGTNVCIVYHTHAYTYTHTDTHMYARTHARTHAHTHTHTHTHTHVCLDWKSFQMAYLQFFLDCPKVHRVLDNIQVAWCFLRIHYTIEPHKCAHHNIE